MAEFKIPTKPPLAGVLLGLTGTDESTAVPMKMSASGALVVSMDSSPPTPGEPSEVAIIEKNYSMSFTYDSNDNIDTQTREYEEDGSTITETRTFSWDSNGNILTISNWS